MPRIRENGFSLLEIVIYIALLAVISVFLTQSVLSLATAYRKAQAERDVLAAGRTAMETISREVQRAKSVYQPTSVFAADAGQLSLETPLDPMSGESAAYADFYVDNGRLYEKREGADALPLTPESVNVAKFYVERIPAGSRESARITLEIVSRPPGKLDARATLISSFTPRGNY